MRHSSSCASVVFEGWTVSTGKFISFSGVNLYKEKDKMYHTSYIGTYVRCIYYEQVVSRSVLCVCKHLSASWTC